MRSTLLPLLLLLLVACGGGQGDGAAPPPDGDGADPPVVGPVWPDDAQEGDPLTGVRDRDRPAPLVLDEDDARGLAYPLELVQSDGTVRRVEDADAMVALLRGEGAGAPPPAEVEYVRLFYATDRNREPPGWGPIVRPLLPSASALLLAVLVTLLLRRLLRPEVRWVAHVLGGALVLVAAGFLARGALLSAETLRLTRETDVLYGSERSAHGGLEFGVVVVSIPAQRHRIAQIELPSLWKGELLPDPTRHFVVDEVAPLPEDRFFDELAAAVAAAPHRDACVFVHGYNNTFAYAAMRLAQIVHDVGFEGAPILYSWPSTGAVALYTYDKENADWSAGNLAGFLRALEARSGAEHVHLLAHSMGSRVLSTAMMQAVRPRDEAAGGAAAEPFFSELVLAAPDLDADAFERFIAPELTRRVGRVTLYASDRDEALLASVQLNGQRRAGMAGDSIVIVEGMDSVDVTRVAGGHAYIADSGRVLGDLVDVLEHRRNAAERATLAPRERGGERYWEMVGR